MSGEIGLNRLLTDGNFRRLLGAMRRRSIPWDEFLTYPQPYNMSPVDSWDLLIDFGRFSSVPVPIPNFDNHYYWYRRTHEIDNAAIIIFGACRAGSRLHRIMTSPAGQYFLVNAQIEETVAVAQLDGLAIDTERAETLLRSGRKPQTPTERLLNNSFAALNRIPELVDVPFSRDLFIQMQESLLEGVDVGALSLRPASRGLIHAGQDWSVPDQLQFGERQLQLLADYLNGESSDADDLVFLRGELAADSFRYYRPLGLVSSQVGRLASRLFAFKNGMPGLTMLSLSKKKADWELGLIGPPSVTYDSASYAATYEHSPYDLTAEHTLLVQLALIALEDVRARIDEWERRDAEMRQLLREEPLLNQRQRSILGRAFRNPDAEFRIRYHQKNHGIHYTTARRDLLELAEQGYLVVDQPGKAFIFRRGPRLDELDREHAG